MRPIPDGFKRFAPKAKRVLCLFQSGGLSHVDLFDDKPMLHEHAGKELPPSIKGTQRLTGMTSGQSAYPVVPPLKTGKRCGKHGTWISDLLPHIQTLADDICIIKSLHTEAINHDPGITYMNTGNQLPGYASMGAWVSYGLGTVNENLPAFIAMVSQGTGKTRGSPSFHDFGAAAFCLPLIKVWGCAQAKARSSTCKTRPASSQPSEGPRWMISQSLINCVRKTLAIRKRSRASKLMKWRIGCRPRFPISPISEESPQRP